MAKIKRSDTITGLTVSKVKRESADTTAGAEARPKVESTAGEPPQAEPAALTAKLPDAGHGRELVAQEDVPRKKRHVAWGYLLAMLVCLAVFLVSGGMLLNRWIQDRKTEDSFAQLYKLAATPAPATAEQGTSQNQNRFAALRAKNPDFMGWISIADTNLSFPVMDKPEVQNYYLRHDFNGEYSVYGVPYIDEKCSMNPRSTNVIIYGHNMKTGTIFGCLTDYKKQENYQKHPEIEFDTIYGDAAYSVYAAFAIDVVQDTSFAYNTYVELDEDAFADFVGQCRQRSDVDSGLIPQYGDTLLTLSTCEYSTDNGRYVVCAYKKAE
jgi:sortase B